MAIIRFQNGTCTGIRIRLASLDISTGRVGGLETALRALHQGNVDMGFLQENNLMQGIHTRHGTGYNVWAMDAESWHWGGVTVVWRSEKGWQVEVTARFGPNVVSFLLTSGSRQWYVVGAYVTPNNAPDVYSMYQALRAATKGLEMILVGDLNVWLGDPSDKREEDLATDLLDRGLVNMTDHFIPQKWYRGSGSWKW